MVKAQCNHSRVGSRVRRSYGARIKTKNVACRYTLWIGENPDWQNHHIVAGELQALLQRQRCMIVQPTSEKVFLLKNQRAAEKYGARKFLRDRFAELFQLGDQIDRQAIARFGVPAQAARVLDETLEIVLD